MAKELVAKAKFKNFTRGRSFVELLDRVDSFFDTVESEFGTHMQCGKGCSACCIGGLTITPIEAAWISHHYPELQKPENPKIQAKGAESDSPPCAYLDSEGACTIYQARPVVCRTHGLPIRLDDVIQTCHLNFQGKPLEDLPPGSVLNQQTISTMLAAINAAFCDELEVDRAQRVKLEDLL
ncbi:YkgJ family cysteine cluster protein [Myxococcota bacterium]|nr:YkgJ family cysteine cluster protein [Myxococcota bacterium]